MSFHNYINIKSGFMPLFILISILDSPANLGASTNLLCEKFIFQARGKNHRL